MYSVFLSITQMSASVTSRIKFDVRFMMDANIEVWFSRRKVEKAIAKINPRYFARSCVSIFRATKFMGFADLADRSRFFCGAWLPPQAADVAEGHSSRRSGPFIERFGESLGHSRSHPDPLNRCAERKDDLAAAGRDSVPELALVVWSQGAMDESASLTQWCALGSRLRFHRLDRLGHLCLLHSFFEPPVPLVFIPLHHGLHVERSSHRGSPPVVVTVSSLARTFCLLRTSANAMRIPNRGLPGGIVYVDAYKCLCVDAIASSMGAMDGRGTNLLHS